jgi:arginine:agmatine antiporter
MAASDITAVRPEAAPAAAHASVGLFGATALVAGSMIGSGIFLLPASLGAIGSISILGWIVATLAALAIGGMFAWLASVAPQAKGIPDYVQAGLGQFFGVQTAVAYCANNWIGTAAVALAVAGPIGFLIPALAPPGPRLMLTLASIWLAVGASWVGPRLIARIEGVTLAVGLLPVLVAATFGWFAFHPTTFVASWNPQGLSVTSAVGASAIGAFWAFLGIEGAAAVAGVVRNPGRNVPGATLLGVFSVAILYISACAALMGILPAAALAKSSAPFAEAGKAALGLGLAAAIAVCALLRAQGCISGWMLVTSETSRSAADGGLFPRFFRTRLGERASSANLLTAGGVMSLMAVMTASPTLGQQFAIMADIAVILSLYSYALAGASLIRLSGGLAPGRRLAARLIALAAVGCSIALIASGKPFELALCAIPLLAAAALYLRLRRR